jgi:protein-disulfide isomerase
MAEDGTEGGRPATRNRRGLLVFAAAGAAAVAAPRIWTAFAPPPPGTPIPGLPGFVRLDDSPVSGSVDPFAGLDAPDPDAIAPARMPAAGPDLCAALFRDGIAPGTVPIAFFTDINCPFCRAMERWLPDMGGARASLTWHDLPLLGPASRAAAQAVAAAHLQGAGNAMRARLHRARLQPTPDYIRSLADGIGLDADRLVADMAGPAVTARLAESLGLFHGFRAAGTPTLIVGGTLAVGQRSETFTEGLIDAAADRPDRLPCA